MGKFCAKDFVKLSLLWNFTAQNVKILFFIFYKLTCLDKNKLHLLVTDVAVWERRYLSLLIFFCLLPNVVSKDFRVLPV